MIKNVKNTDIKKVQAGDFVKLQNSPILYKCAYNDVYGHADEKVNPDGLVVHVSIPGIPDIADNYSIDLDCFDYSIPKSSL